VESSPEIKLQRRNAAGKEAAQTGPERMRVADVIAAIGYGI
jgi:hypothetical protein